MARFYFDRFDGRRFRPDLQGSEFASPELAHQDAIGALYAMSRTQSQSGLRREIRIKVRNDRGDCVAEAAMVIDKASNRKTRERALVPA